MTKLTAFDGRVRTRGLWRNIAFLRNGPQTQSEARGARHGCVILRRRCRKEANLRFVKPQAFAYPVADIPRFFKPCAASGPTSGVASYSRRRVCLLQTTLRQSTSSAVDRTTLRLACDSRGRTQSCKQTRCLPCCRKKGALAPRIKGGRQPHRKRHNSLYVEARICVVVWTYPLQRKGVMTSLSFQCPLIWSPSPVHAFFKAESVAIMCGKIRNPLRILQGTTGQTSSRSCPHHNFLYTLLRAPPSELRGLQGFRDSAGRKQPFEMQREARVRMV